MIVENIITYRPLKPLQFFAILGMLDISIQDVDNAIDTVILTSNERAIAKSKVRYSRKYRWDNVLFTCLAPPLNITGEEINTAWLTAQEIV